MLKAEGVKIDFAMGAGVVVGWGFPTTAMVVR